ncbi:MAG: hypothetical protein JSS76_19720 [Bacteroidetes bacterium]|nr:hypothetical protein [Bacteroidota bacterium]
MKQIRLPLALVLILIAVSSCKKSTCTDANAPNFGAQASCTDATSVIIGTFVGTFADSVDGYGQTLTSNQTVTITRIDASHIQVTPANSQFFPFAAKVTAAGNGYALTVNPGTYQGESYTRAKAIPGPIPALVQTDLMMPALKCFCTLSQ